MSVVAGRFSELAHEHIQSAGTHLEECQAHYAAMKTQPSVGLLRLILAVQSLTEALDCLRMQVDAIDARGGYDAG